MECDVFVTENVISEQKLAIKPCNQQLNSAHVHTATLPYCQTIDFVLVMVLLLIGMSKVAGVLTIFTPPYLFG